LLEVLVGRFQRHLDECKWFRDDLNTAEYLPFHRNVLPLAISSPFILIPLFSKKLISFFLKSSPTTATSLTLLKIVCG